MVALYGMKKNFIFSFKKKTNDTYVYLSLVGADLRGAQYMKGTDILRLCKETRDHQNGM